MKIDRFIVALTSSDRFIELKPDPEGSLCFASEVVKLEAINAELLEACESLLRFAERDRLPTDVAVNQARAAIAKAEENT